MVENTSARMIELFGRLRKQMNGAVVDAMRERGAHYPMNYGVSVPTIAAVSREYGPDHALAALLYRQQVRELKIAAAYVDNPSEVSLEQMRRWADDFDQAELAEQTVYALFRHVPFPIAATGAVEWLASQRSYVCYGGLLLVGSLFRTDAKECEQWAERMCEATISALECAPLEPGARPVMVRAAAAAWVAAVRVDRTLQQRSAARLGQLVRAGNVLASSVLEEASWQFDYLG